MTPVKAIDLYYDPFDFESTTIPTQCGSGCVRKRRCISTRSTTSTR